MIGSQSYRDKVDNRAVLEYTFVIGKCGDIILICDSTKIGKANFEKILLILFSIDEGLDDGIGCLKWVNPD